MSIDRYVGLKKGLPWSGLVHHLRIFFAADCELEVLQVIRELVNIVSNMRFGGSTAVTISSKQLVLNGIFEFFLAGL